MPTPLGAYRPDWAGLVDTDAGTRLYLVVETKGSLYADELRLIERRQDQVRPRTLCRTGRAGSARALRGRQQHRRSVYRHRYRLAAAVLAGREAAILELAPLETKRYERLWQFAERSLEPPEVIDKQQERRGSEKPELRVHLRSATLTTCPDTVPAASATTEHVGVLPRVSNRTELERDIIRSARIQFSPTTQSVKSTALDKIVEQSIGIYGVEGLTIDEIVMESCIVINGGRVPVVRHVDVRESIRRLENAERVMVLDSNAGKYGLTESSRVEFDVLRQDTVTRARRIVHTLFADQLPDPQQMVEPFYHLLGRIFSRLSNSYVSALRGDRSNVMPVPQEEIVSAISTISAHYNVNDPILLRAATRFFAANDPDSVTTKWNLAQNFYIALALGMDPSGTLLSDELVGNCSLYLDTNVVIEGLEETARFS